MADLAIVRQDLPPAEDVPVEAAGSVDVPHVEDEVSEFLHFHAPSLPGARTGTTPLRASYPGRSWPGEQSRRHKRTQIERLPKKLYERELFRLQGELVKVQEWVRAEGQRLVVVFEGRDAAGKGGTIQRVTQYLNPRVARIVALPAPTERERGQWYFQRYIAHLPAPGEIVLLRPLLVQPGRRRAGDGLLHGRGVPPLPAPVPDLRADARRGRDPAAQVLVLGQRRRAGGPLPLPPGRPDAALEAVADGPRVASPGGRTTRGPRTRCSSTPTSPRRRWYVVESDDKRRARINMIAHLLSTLDYHEVAAPPADAAEAAAADRLRAAAPRHADVRARPRRHPRRLTAGGGPSP